MCMQVWVCCIDSYCSELAILDFQLVTTDLFRVCVCMMRNHDVAAICQADWPVEVSTLSNRTLLLRPPNNDSHGGATSAALLCEEIGLNKYFIFQFQN